MSKPFSWSFSKYSAYHTCPKRHYEVELAKNFADSTEQLDYGNAVHKAIAGAILHKTGLPAVGSGRDRVEPAPLPDSMKDYQRWVDVVAAGHPVERILVERKYALTRDFQPTEWFANNVWVRVVVDLLALRGKEASALDWKTGKIKHDSRQLMISAQAIFAHHPEIETVKTRFVWLKEECTTPDTFTRATIAQEWPPVLEGVKQMEEAARTLTYPPKPGKLCRQWCPVTSCPFFGKSHS